MSLKEWLFGAEVPGAERSAKTPEQIPTPAPKKDSKPDQPAATAPAGEKPVDPKPVEAKAMVVKPVDPPTPAKDGAEPKLEPFSGPAEKPADVEQTQILTKAELKKLTPDDPDRKSINFVPPPKAGPPADRPDIPGAESADSTAEDKKPEPPAVPLKAATWKVASVNEDWAPATVAKKFPELARNDYRDHEIVERIISGDWRVIGGSRRGRKQAHDSRFREDAMAFGHTPAVTVLSVADGAGSCTYSRIGSHIAVHEIVAAAISAVDALSDDPGKDDDKFEQALKKLLADAVRKSRMKVVEVAEKSGLNPKEFRATLLTIIHYHAGGKELLLSNQVGDGAVSLLLKDKSVKKFGDSDSGAFSGEVSCFLTDSDAVKKADNIQVIRDVDQVEAMFLCSDGIEDPFYPIEKRALDIFKQWSGGVDGPLDGFKTQTVQPPVFEQEAAAWALAQWLEFEKRGENDDRTVLLMHRRPINVKF